MRPLGVTGNVNVDLIMGPVAPWPLPGTEVIARHDNLRLGGSAGNTALAWAGLEASFVIASNVGDDVLGRWLRGALAAHSASWVVSPAQTTVSVGLIHPGDERTFFTTRGHLAHLSWPDVRGQLAGFEDALLLICASFLTEGLTADYPALFDWARQRRVDLALDPGWPVGGWTAGERARVRGWLARTRHLLINEIEATALTQTDGIDTAMPALLAMMPQGAVAVVKAGSKGAFGSAGHGMVHAPAPRVTVVDTIGAGDVFNAGYLLATARGCDLKAALTAGCTLASGAVSTSPRVYRMPDIFAGVT